MQRMSQERVMGNFLFEVLVHPNMGPGIFRSILEVNPTRSLAL